MTKACKRQSLPGFRPPPNADALFAAKDAMFKRLLQAFTNRDAVAVLPNLVGVDYVQQAIDDPGFPLSVVPVESVDYSCDEPPEAAVLTQALTPPRSLNRVIRRKIRFAAKVD